MVILDLIYFEYTLSHPLHEVWHIPHQKKDSHVR